jgi:hypothetical protein
MAISIAFFALAVVHLLPVGPVFDPRALVRLYGVAPHDAALLALLRHRAVLLAIVGVLCLWAAFAPGPRPAALLAATINIASFIVMYALYGAPTGPLRTIALVDALAIAPLAVAAWGTIFKG